MKKKLPNKLIWFLFFWFLCAGSFAQDVGVKAVLAYPRGAVTCRSLGCLPIEWDGDEWINDDLTTAQANAGHIQTYLNAMSQANGRIALVVDNQYAIADNDNDDIDIKTPPLAGGMIISPGKNWYPFIDEEQGRGTGVGGGFYHIEADGNDDDTMIEYHGAFTYLDLKLVGGIYTASQYSTLVADQNAGNCPDVLLKCVNIVNSPGNEPRGLKNKMDLCLYISDIGVLFPGPDAPGMTGADHADTVNVMEFEFRDVNIAYQIDNQQSTQHVFYFLKSDGSPCTYAIDSLRGGDVHIVEAYHPNGTLIHVGANQTHHVANYVVDNFKADNVLLSPSMKLLMNDCRDSLVRFRAGGSYGGNHTLSWPVIDTVTTDSDAQPDIRVDLRQQDPAEALAYRQRPGKGLSDFDTTTAYGTTAAASTLVWLAASDSSTLTPSTPVNNGAISQWNSKVGADTYTLAIAENSPLYKKNQTNWNPAIYTLTASQDLCPLADTSPAAVDTEMGDITMMAVVTARQLSVTQQFGGIYRCINDNTATTSALNGFGMYCEQQTGNVFFHVEDATPVQGTAALKPFKPTLLVGIREKATDEYWLCYNRINNYGGTTGVGAGTDLTDLTNGTATIGGVKFNSSFIHPFQGWISEIFIDNDCLAIPLDGSHNAGTTDATGTTITMSGVDVTSGFVGRTLWITGGTGFRLGFYTIVSVNAGSDTITVDRDCSTTSSPSALYGMIMTAKYVERANYLRAKYGVW